MGTLWAYFVWDPMMRGAVEYANPARPKSLSLDRQSGFLRPLTQ